MSRDDRSRPLVTKIGRAEHGSNRYFSFSVENELLGHETLTGLTILSVTGRRATPDQVEVLNDVATVLSSADPRIWLFKTVRLASAYGGMVAGLVAGNLCLHRASVGHLTASQAAEALVRIGADSELDTIAERVLSELETRSRIVGFGVPFRKADERAVALTRRLDELGRRGGRYFTVYEQVAAVLSRERNISPNLGGCLAASFLDLGFDPAHVGPLVFALGQHTFLANAYEGANQAHEALRELRVDQVEYVGVDARLSPRARRLAANR